MLYAFAHSAQSCWNYCYSLNIAVNLLFKNRRLCDKVFRRFVQVAGVKATICVWDRLEIASCSEHAYHFLSVKDAQSLLMIPTDEEVSEFIFEVRPVPCDSCAL